MPPLPAYDASDPAAYVASRLALVGDRDPLPLLEGAPERVAEAVAGLSENGARQPESDGAWSVLQVLRHLADSEVVYGYRLRLIVAADRPEIPGYDQEAWAGALHYHRGTVADALADYAAGRRMTVAFLRSLDADEWERFGFHSERGQESVRRIATLLAAHDLGHEQQITRVRETIGA
ncbi:DinB family protein [Rubrivirga marina]|uniref:DinB-like domain-containing protein n=1 Tax=Rubrivirga marina TaxID=1196024 RepID=A0A271J014_9BACT|nr:DinB family protein [Rubrivirga marina]PAP76700.1 hypothetical protein BSZ37_09735 [Rubrivirga marina]